MQVERARKAARLDESSDQPVDTELKRSEADEPIKLSLAAKAAAAAAAAAADKQQSRGAAAAAPPLFGDDDGEWRGGDEASSDGVGWRPAATAVAKQPTLPALRSPRKTS